jgi:hypothetical protein
MWIEEEWGGLSLQLACDGFNPLQTPYIWLRAGITELGLMVQTMDQPQTSEEGKATCKEEEGIKKEKYVGPIMRLKINW